MSLPEARLLSKDEVTGLLLLFQAMRLTILTHPYPVELAQ